MTITTTSFGDRLNEAVGEKKSCLVVGLDPVLEKLPSEAFHRLGMVASGGEGATAKAAAAIGMYLNEVIDAVADVAVAVKPNSAFFERFGAAGLDCLRQVCAVAQKAGLLVICDAKRGDIAHTAQAYADAFLGDLPDTPGPHVDAVTISPFLGSDSVEPYLQYAGAGKGVFVLVRTSNPSGAELQDLEAEGRPLYLHIAEQVARWGESCGGASEFTPVGAVVGATQVSQAERVREAIPRAMFLVPGFGAQGAQADDLKAYFLAGGRGAVVNASRSVLYAGSTERGQQAASWKDAVRQAAIEARDALEDVRRSVG